MKTKSLPTYLWFCLSFDQMVSWSYYPLSSFPNHQPSFFFPSDLFTIPNGTLHLTLPSQPGNHVRVLVLSVLCAAYVHTEPIWFFLLYILFFGIAEIFNLTFVVPSIIWFLLLKLHHYTDMRSFLWHHSESIHRKIRPSDRQSIQRKTSDRGFMLRKLFNIYHLYYQPKCDSWTKQTIPGSFIADYGTRIRNEAIKTSFHHCLPCAMLARPDQKGERSLFLGKRWKALCIHMERRSLSSPGADSV